MSKAKLMLGNAVEISLIFPRILGPLVLGWAPNYFVLGAQLAPGKEKLVCIPEDGTDSCFIAPIIHSNDQL